MNWRELEAEMIRTRRDLHRYPEAAWTEFRTSSLVAERLERLGYKPRVGAAVIDKESVMGRPSEEEIDQHIRRAVMQGGNEGWIKEMERYTGVVAELDTGKPGPTVALRFDIDCVDVDEDTSPEHRPVRENFASLNPHLMHACGHDAHTSIGLGVAETLMAKEGLLKGGKVRLIFQPGEEGCRGAYAMTHGGVVDGADFFLAMHIGSGVPTGTFGINALGYLATTKFDARFTGVPAHAAGAPHLGRNALLAAASAALGLHSIAPHSGGVMRLNVGVLQAGTGRNVVPADALMKVETRGETQQIADYVYGRAVEVLNGAAAMYGVKVELTKAGQGTTARGDKPLVRQALEAVRALNLFEHVEENVRAGGSEDATWMMRRVQENGGQATYMGLGSDITAPHHNGRFDLDERSMLLGVRAMTAITEALLAAGGEQ
ncbi:MAG: amidohydrolase [Fretibacterium sp.]|nr:amidohydrolase [Fretibacterium sp.]